MAVRLALALCVATIAALLVQLGASRHPGFHSDFDQIWYGARALTLGKDPYALIGPGREWGSLPWPLFYPLPALIPAVPLTYVDVVTARSIVAAVCVGCFAFLVSRHSLAHLASLLSASLLTSVSLVQFTPLLACAALSPAFGWVLCCKPNVGLATLSTARTNRWLMLSLSLSATLVVISLIVEPAWPGRWIATVREGEHFDPYVLRPGGVLLLLALLRWRRFEARWLAAFALIPGTPGVYEALILFTAPQSFRSILLLALGTHAAYFWAFPFDQSTFVELMDTQAMALLAFVYLPALIGILRRPNEGETPEWLEELMVGIVARLAPLWSRLPRP